MSQSLENTLLPRHDSGSKRNRRKSEQSEQHASVASPNGAGGRGGAEPPTKIFLAFRDPYIRLKLIQISLIVAMRRDRKVKNSMELKNKIIVKKNWLINVITQY